MFQRGLLDDPDVTQLSEAVLVILEKVGVLCQNEDILKALAEAGAVIDVNSDSARFPRSLVAAFVDGLRAEILKVDENIQPHFVAPPLPRVETQVAQYFYDDATGERRIGNRHDAITMIKLGDVLHPEAGVGHSLLLADQPPLVEPLESAMLLAEYAHRPGPAFAWHVDQVDYLVQMGHILGIPEWFTWGAICFASPLRFEKDVADKFVRRVRSGVPTGLAGMQLAGATTPVTVAGFVAVAGAEFIATWIAARALNPDIPLTGVLYGGTLDMKTGAVSYSSADAMLRASACSEFLRRWCGQNVAVGGGEYCDAKRPGLYAALEKAYKAMTIAAFTGHHPSVGEGMLDEGKVISPVQLLLEREIGLSVGFLGRRVDVNPETIAIDTILDVGVGLEKSYLETEHTLQHYRESLWIPDLLDRSGWNGADNEAKLLERMRRKVGDLLSTYQKPSVDPDKLAAMREVVDRARRELLS